MYLQGLICDSDTIFMDWGLTNAYIESDSGFSVCTTSKGGLVRSFTIVNAVHNIIKF